MKFTEVHKLLIEDETMATDVLELVPPSEVPFFDLVSRGNPTVLAAASVAPTAQDRCAFLHTLSTTQGLVEFTESERSAEVLVAALNHPCCDAELVNTVVMGQPRLARKLAMAAARTAHMPDGPGLILTDDTVHRILQTLGVSLRPLNRVELYCVLATADAHPEACVSLINELGEASGIAPILSVFANTAVPHGEFDKYYELLVAALESAGWDSFTRRLGDEMVKVFARRVLTGMVWCWPGEPTTRLTELASKLNTLFMGAQPTVGQGMDFELVALVTLFNQTLSSDHVWNIAETAWALSAVLCPELLARLLSTPATKQVLEAALVTMEPETAFTQLAACPDPTMVSDAVRLDVLSRLAGCARQPQLGTDWADAALTGLNAADLPLHAVKLLSLTQRTQVRELLLTELGRDLTSQSWTLFFELSHVSDQPVGDVLGMCGTALTRTS